MSILTLSQEDTPGPLQPSPKRLSDAREFFFFSLGYGARSFRHILISQFEAARIVDTQKWVSAWGHLHYTWGYWPEFAEMDSKHERTWWCHPSTEPSAWSPTSSNGHIAACYLGLSIDVPGWDRDLLALENDVLRLLRHQALERDNIACYLWMQETRHLSLSC